MTSKRLYYLLVCSICLLLLGLLAGTYGANKLLTAEAAKLTDLKANSEAQTREQQSLIRAKKDVKKYAGLQKIAKAVVPEDKDQAEAVREIVKIATNNNVSLSAITFPSSSLGTSVGAAAGSAGAGSASASPAPSAAVPSAAANSKAALSQLQAVKNIPGVYQLTITVEGDTNQPVLYYQFINFLHDLEHNRRTAQVSSITLTPDAKNPSFLTFTLTLNEYIKP